MKRASRRRELDCVGQQRQQRTAHLSAVDPDENGSLRQINLQRQPHLPAQLVRALGQTVQKIGQVGLFQRQRQPPVLHIAQIGQILRCPQQLIAGAVEHGQILLHSRILCFGKKREKCSGYGQQRRQRRGDRLRGAAERGKFVARILRRQEQQQRIVQRLRIGADADAAGHHGQHGRACVKHFRQCRVLR